MLILFRLSNLEHMEHVAATLDKCIHAQRNLLAEDPADDLFIRGLCHSLLQVWYPLIMV